MVVLFPWSKRFSCNSFLVLLCISKLYREITHWISFAFFEERERGYKRGGECDFGGKLESKGKLKGEKKKVFLEKR